MNLLFEIGTEELPAGEVETARNALSAHFVRGAAEARLRHGVVRTFATPRRLALHVADLSPEADTVEETVMGPAARAAFDAEGRPTKAAEGFARSQGVTPDQLVRVETPRGEYLAAKVVRGGQSARDIVTALLCSAPAAIPWKRSMRWAWGDIAFARPVHWLVALLGSDVLPVSYAGIDAGRTTFGHRFLAPGAITLQHADGYLGVLRSADVVADVEERRETIRAGVAAAAQAEGLCAIIDDELIDEVVHLVELPVPLLGRFDQALLEVPREVLITTMRTHQRYFAVESAPGTLANAFVYISNMRVARPEVVTAGNLRVLRARLEDARFFYREDRKRSLEARVTNLADVVYIDRIGSVADRTARIVALADRLAGLFYPGQPTVAAHAARAAQLCKADLVTGMVYQFPELQGIMGRYYALADGEPREVAVAIEEHYRPRGASDAPAESPAGVVVAVAEKLDALAGCFALGLIPSGSADPYALRRAALGVLRTAMVHNLRFRMDDAVQAAVAGLPTGLRPATEVTAELAEFVRGRLRAWLANEGAADVVDAVVEVSLDDLPSAPARLAALASIRDEAGFADLAVAFKRTVNIVRKAIDEDAGVAATLGASTDAQLGALVEPAELALVAALRAAEPTVAAQVAAGRWHDAATTLVQLKPAIDAFFDGVLVNAPDPTLRLARLALLARVRALFLRFADISRVQVAG